MGKTSRGQPELFALGLISTAQNETRGEFSPDGRSFFFSRLSKGNGDIYGMKSDFIDEMKSRAWTDFSAFHFPPAG